MLQEEHNLTLESEISIRVFEPDDYIIVELTDLIDLSFLGNGDHERKELEVIRLTNLERSKRRLQPLVRNDNLSRSALLHTLDMTENHFISHQGSDGSDLKTRIKRIGYEHYFMIGENLAMGYLEAEKVIQGWMASPGHRDNILRPEFNEIGVAFIEGIMARTADAHSIKAGYWTQHFGSRSRRENLR